MIRMRVAIQTIRKEKVMPFLLKELLKAGGYIILLTLALYYFVDNTLFTAFIIALVCQVTLLIFDFKKIKNGYNTSKKQ